MHLLKRLKYLIPLLAIFFTGCSTEESLKDISDATYTIPKSSSISIDEVDSIYYASNTPYIGEHKMLIIPVHFKDDTTCKNAVKNAGNCKAVRQDIQKTFFGTPSETGWESVASYYEKSSYGKLKIEGLVTDWFVSSKTSLEYMSWTGTQANYPSQLLLREAVSWFKNNNTSEVFKSFDANNDGYIDSIWLVYNHVIDNDNDFWAYKYYDYPNINNTFVVPKAYQYGFASINFMYEDSSFTVDAHTFIHETGHILGLDDYYNTDYDSSPLGGLDMMDYNIGDHTAFSKYLLNWTFPIILNSPGKITLHSFEQTGEFILIPTSKYNNSPFSEYILIEYITPTGLNKQDSSHRLKNTYPYFYKENGIRVTHIDARLATSAGAGEYTNIHTINSTYAHSNTPSSSKNKNIALIQLISARNKNFFQNNLDSTYQDLFTYNTSFNSSLNMYAKQFNIHSGSFNVNEKIPYSFTVKSIKSNEAVLVFTSN